MILIIQLDEFQQASSQTLNTLRVISSWLSAGNETLHDNVLLVPICTGTAIAEVRDLDKQVLPTGYSRGQVIPVDKLPLESARRLVLQYVGEEQKKPLQVNRFLDPLIELLGRVPQFLTFFGILVKELGVPASLDDVHQLWNQIKKDISRKYGRLTWEIYFGGEARDITLKLISWSILHTPLHWNESLNGSTIEDHAKSALFTVNTILVG